MDADTEHEELRCSMWRTMDGNPGDGCKTD